MRVLQPLSTEFEFAYNISGGMTGGSNATFSCCGFGLLLKSDLHAALEEFER